MLVNTNKMISISEANKNFSKVAKIVDEDKSVVIMKNNKPRYVILDFDKFSKDALSEDQTLDKIADKILDDNIEAFKELANR
ncbi:type II toxin-antitoxin system prevent-host-death family antitoxin [Clostridium ljungdahlii]|uniref:Antitoxin n=1 Tax=Clostridium ljungdahlii TaxID=1538 RepID=A0A170NKV3_9CLOT|nr:type II toxin-antitoxin system prevent-host-death family antitoxin [Clostridium ljungdahlii]OAA91288.1 Phd_YefM [Clostridium ljungdahlii]